ncbi:hypothetical protein [Psychromonas sp. Urea-02u-13]|uniref:hypothetical protein n=1 Tax=Psychromonas sp. Urea-02u-13 TaxID=2058326 RepID=UPI000C3472D3|nr:hypothetical protein [Psychromonas sp. Urea-02u-13]PKG39700.1 hypothetical protein CXF74_07040 [Psychromonas sp. Urea-02u-13]
MFQLGTGSDLNKINEIEEHLKSLPTEITGNLIDLKLLNYNDQRIDSHNGTDTVSFFLNENVNFITLALERMPSSNFDKDKEDPTWVNSPTDTIHIDLLNAEGASTCHYPKIIFNKVPQFSSTYHLQIIAPKNAVELQVNLQKADGKYIVILSHQADF